MQYTKLRNSDLNVSRICMGCMGVGGAASGQHSWTIDEEHSREIIKRGLQDSKRLQQDSYAKFKYDATKEQDEVIIRRVQEIAGKRDVTMTEISLAWLLTKVTSPVVGATKFHHIEGAEKAVELELTEDELHYPEEPYVPMH